MIKINLLPSKRKPAKKLTELQKQGILGSLILVLVLGGMWFYYITLSGKISSLTRGKALAETKIREQDNLLKEVKTVEEERAKVAEKIAVIEQLKKNQAGLVRLLDEVSKALPMGVNLTGMSEKDGKVDLDGTAFTNNEIVKFVDNLKACPFFAEVFLVESVQATQDAAEIYKYKLQFQFKGV